ncbi:MAG: hypothetical protein II999_06065 [Bacteroidaceae bacterium]|nr:hypothetical protein [Bacteroidaceae bacterium]
MIKHVRFKTLQAFLAGMLVGTSQLVAQEDYTSYLKNPSFETDGLSGWTVKNMATQSNSVFSIKNGTYYIGRGSVLEVILVMLLCVRL